MSELAFTLARIGFLVLLWVFVLLTIRALRRDVADTATPGAQRRPARPSAPAPAPAPSPPPGAARRLLTPGPRAGAPGPR